MKKYCNPKLILLRLCVIPFVFCIVLVKYIYNAFKQTWLVFLWGGEWVIYDEDSQKRMQDIHDLMKD